MIKQALVKREPGKNRLLHKDHPFLSLLQMSLEDNLINRKEFLTIQSQTMMLLKNLIGRYTNWESNSVKVETAESLLNAIYYTLDTSLEVCPTQEDALSCLRAHGVKRLYQKGVEMITQKVKEAKANYQILLCKKPELDHVYYDATVNEAIPAFFINYQILLAAHDIPADIDYPILFDQQSRNGIDYMLHYIEKLELEASFLALFDTDKVRRCLKGYGQMYRIDYRNTFMNLMEPIFNQSLFSLLSGGWAGSLMLSIDQYELLVSYLNTIASEALDAAIRKALDSLVIELSILRSDLMSFLEKQIPTLVQSILRAKENNSYHHLIVSGGSQEQQPILLLQGKSMMTDADFNQLVQKLLNSKDSQEKTLLVRSQCRTSGDFMDLLESGCLWEEDFDDLFKSLYDEELAVLSLEALWDGIRENRLSQIIAGWSGTREGWVARLVNFLNQLGMERLNHLNDLMKRLVT